MKKAISNQGVKQTSSPIAGGSGSEAKKRPPQQVEILDDVWLEALKHLTCLKWSKMRLVTRQLNGLVGRNVSRLPLAVIDRAEVKYKERKRIEYKIIIADSPISPDAEWFKNGGMTLDLPADIQLDKAFIGIELKDNFCADLCVLGPDKKKKLTPYEKGRPWFAGETWFTTRFQSEVLFYGEFRPHQNRSSMASLAFFLKLLYDPSTYVKKLSMCFLDTKLKDFLFPGEEQRRIRCGEFHNRHEGKDASVDEVCESVSWLEQNLQADFMYFPADIVESYYYNPITMVREQFVTNPEATERNKKICDAMTNFVFGASWISAKQLVRLSHIYDPECCMYLFEALIKKFRNITTAQSIFPHISFGGVDSTIKDSIDKFLSGKEDTVKENVPEGCCGREVYTISNGLNQMRVHIMRRAGCANMDLSLKLS